MKSDYRDMLKVGDRVRCIEEDDQTGDYTPHKGICGTVEYVGENDLRVRWDSGTMPGAWWCKYDIVMPSNV